MQKFNFKKFLKSFTYASAGVRDVFVSEQNFRFHVFVAGFVVVFLFSFSFTYIESAIVILCIGFVMVTEIINTAIEHTWNHLEPHHHPVVKTVKDMMAAAVIMASITSVIVGVLVVSNHFFM